MRLPLFALAFAGMSCRLFAGGESTAGFTSHPMTVDEAVQLALKQNPSILTQIQQLKLQKGLVFQAQAALLPHLIAAANYSQEASELVPHFAAASPPNLDLLAVPSGSTLVVTPTSPTTTKTNAQTLPLSALTGSS